MPNAKTNWREPLRDKITNCIWRDSWVIVVKELHADVNGRQCHVVPFVWYWLSVCGCLLNFIPLNRLFIYLWVHAVNRLHLESTLGNVRFTCQIDRWTGRREERLREGKKRRREGERKQHQSCSLYTRMKGLLNGRSPSPAEPLNKIGECIRCFHPDGLNLNTSYDSL